MGPDATPQVQVGDIVLYRSNRDVVMPAIVTALTDEPGYVHLHLFPPPEEGSDILDRQWGVPHHSLVRSSFGTWSTRENTSDADAA